jgi:hypothetical protein
MTTDPFIIALDYDGMYNRDPDFWNDFIKMSHTRGHKVVLLTYRDERFDRSSLLDELEKIIPVYYTRGVAKKWWNTYFGTGHVDIWIDDRPEAILNNSSLPPGPLAEWREENKARND